MISAAICRVRLRDRSAIGSADVVVVLGDPIAPFVLIRPAAKVRIGPSDQRGERLGMALLQIEP